MNVSEAVAQRKSVRAYTEQPVDNAVIENILKKAGRAPSGGNVQPWKAFVLNGEKMAEFRQLMEKRLAGERHPSGDAQQYQVYPPKLKEPYRTARFEVGEDMYGLLDISREDKQKRLQWFANNYRFFDAPAAIFCFTDRIMGPPQWADLGMFLQTVMLLCEETGLATCAQECWSSYPDTVSEFCNADENLMLFSGMAIGYEDTTHPVNQLKTKRLCEEEWLTVL